MSKLAKFLILALTLIFSTPSVAAFAESEASNSTKLAVGDQWTYQETNDLTGTATSMLTITVTEVASKDFTVRVSAPNTNASYIMVFDDDWNARVQDQAKFNPHDGTGIPHDPKIGTTWRTLFSWQDLAKGMDGKGTATGQCTRNESVTTQIGTFATLKCVVTVRAKSRNGGPVVREDEITTWYAPTTRRWAKREFTTKIRGRVSEKRTQEIVSFDLKH